MQISARSRGNLLQSDRSPGGHGGDGDGGGARVMIAFRGARWYRRRQSTAGRAAGRRPSLSEDPPMSKQVSRRDFLQAAALAGAGFWIADTARAAQGRSANEQIRFACIGVGGKGRSDTADAAKHGTVVALC